MKSIRLLILAPMLFAISACAQLSTTIVFTNSVDTTINVKAVNNPVLVAGRYYSFPKNGTNVSIVGGVGSVDLPPNKYTCAFVGVPQSFTITVTNAATPINAADITDPKSIVIYSGVQTLTGSGGIVITPPTGPGGNWNVDASGVSGGTNGGGSGNVTGPVSSQLHHLAAFANTQGSSLEDSGIAFSTIALTAWLQATNAAIQSQLQSSNTAYQAQFAASNAVYRAAFDPNGAGVTAATAATNAQAAIILNKASTNSPTIFTPTFSGGASVNGGNLQLDNGQRKIRSGDYINLTGEEEGYIQFAAPSPGTPTMTISAGENNNLVVTSDSDITFNTSVGVFIQGGGSFSGLGSSLTGLNASQLTSGTVPSARVGTGGDGSGTHYLADDGTFKTVSTGSGLAVPQIFYVETNGNDATALVGQHNQPWKTFTNALASITSTPATIILGVGTFYTSASTNGSIVPSNVTIRGQGVSETFLVPGNVASATTNANGIVPLGLVLSGDNIDLTAFTCGTNAHNGTYYIPIVPAVGTNLWIHGMNVVGDSDGIWANAGFAGAVSLMTTNCSGSIDDVRVTSGYDGIVFVASGGGTNSNWRIQNTRINITGDTNFVSVQNHGIYLGHFTNTVQNCNITVNSPGATQVFGVYVSATGITNYLTLANNVFNLTGTSPLWLNVNSTHAVTTIRGLIDTTMVAQNGSILNLDSVSASQLAGSFNSTFLWSVDNTYDIGASGGNRPANIYAGGTIKGNAINVASATANTLAKYDSGKNFVSIANGVGVLTNDASGNLGFTPLLPVDPATSTNNYAAFDANGKLYGTQNGNNWANLTGTNIVLDTSTLAPTSNATNYTAALRGGLPGVQTIYGANTNINLTLVGTNLSDVGRTLYINNSTSSVNCNLTFTFTYRTNQTFSAVVSNGWVAYFNFHSPSGSGTVNVNDAGRMH